MTSAQDARHAEVQRVLERYLVEVVEAWGLCPWALGTRQRRELHVEILWGSASEVDATCDAARRALAMPKARVVMVVRPELVGGSRAIEALRDAVAETLPQAGVAAFGPDGPFELTTPAKLVPLLRRSPDPMLQLVPFAVLDEVKHHPRPVELAEQVRALAGRGAPPPTSIVDSIAAHNHAAVTADRAQRMLQSLADIAADRAAAYARVGIRIAGR